MSTKSGTHRVLASGRRLETDASMNRVLSSGRRLGGQEGPAKRQRTLQSRIESIPSRQESDDDERESSKPSIASRIQVSERKPRENEPSKKLLLQAVSDANKSVLMKLNKTNGLVKVMKPDGTSECLTTRTLAKRLKAKEPTRIDPSSLIQKSEPNLGKMKIRVRNEYCDSNDKPKSTDPSTSPMNFQDDEEDEVNNKTTFDEKARTTNSLLFSFSLWWL